MTSEEVLNRIDDASAKGSSELDLSVAGLAALPAEIGKLTNLTTLCVGGNHLTELPAEIGQLANLAELDLHFNNLVALPAEIGRLTKLTTLNLYMNRLEVLPPEIGLLANLTTLNLRCNRLTQLPAEIGRLANLATLNVERNQLTQLPAKIGGLVKLEQLGLGDNPLTTPPPEIANKGTRAVLAFLRAQLSQGSSRMWLSKLVVVGEGGVGKTSLLRVLRGEAFDECEATTHGMNAHKPLELPHPNQSGVKMRLYGWDFGGQEIYHATHQFFLTDRALFVLVWNARLDYTQCRLDYWLDAIRARAPASPILIVATHLDERAAALPPLKEWQRKYKIVGHHEVSNRTGAGIEDLRRSVAAAASQLPLMGAECPKNWVEATWTIQRFQQYASDRPNSRDYVRMKRLFSLVSDHGIQGDDAVLMLGWYHAIGGILQYPDDPELKEIAILNPWWVSRVISRVLDHKDEMLDTGVFTREHMNKVWEDLPEEVRPRFLRLMERFDMAYRIPEGDGASIVVARLPADPPDYEVAWNAVQSHGLCHEIAMRFRLNTIPAGIPSWFIAREHRFSIGRQWRHGALFADAERRHMGLVRASPHERIVDLTVRGPYPQNFFALLKDGLEVTLARFPGLEIERRIPCPCGNGGRCKTEFDYRILLARLEKGKHAIECPASDADVSIPKLLSGWGPGVQDDLLRQLHQKVAMGFNRQEELYRESAALAQRNFTALFKVIQGQEDSHCPNVFLLRPMDRNRLKSLFGQKLELHLLCQAPGQWHLTREGGRYEFQKQAEWFQSIMPYLRGLIQVLRCAAPLTGPAGALAAPLLGLATTERGAAAQAVFAGAKEVMGNIREDLNLMNELLEQIPALPDLKGAADPVRADGSALRALRKLLDELDKVQKWGELKKVYTPEGHYLWLCPEHAAPYQT